MTARKGDRQPTARYRNMQLGGEQTVKGRDGRTGFGDVLGVAWRAGVLLEDVKYLWTCTCTVKKHTDILTSDFDME